MTDLHALIHRMADRLDHYCQLMADNRWELDPLATEARAAMADGPAVPEGREPASVTPQATAALSQPEPEGATPQPADGEVAELVRLLGSMAAEAELADQVHDASVLDRAINLLSRLSPPQPLPVLTEGTQVIEPTEHTLLVPVAQPVPVSERLPGAGDCLDEGWAWFFNPRTGWRQATQPVHSTYTHWLPANALPMPTHTSEND